MTVAALLCLVIAVHDGDTLTAQCQAAKPIKVRIAAIDAPELRQTFGHAARQQLVRLCLRQQARIETLSTDNYGRTVANVRCGNADLAATQVGTGMAWVYTPYAAQHPQLQPLQQRAQERRFGVWSQKRPLPPWDYRHRYQR